MSQLREDYGVAVCKREPRGENGLEGYQAGDSYFFCKVTDTVAERSHYRAFPTLSMDYYETCSTRVFKRHFEKESVN